MNIFLKRTVPLILLLSLAGYDNALALITYPPSCPDANTALRTQLKEAQPMPGAQPMGSMYQFKYQDVLWRTRNDNKSFNKIQGNIKNENEKFLLVKNNRAINPERYQCFYSLNGNIFNITNVKADAEAAMKQQEQAEKEQYAKHFESMATHFSENVEHDKSQSLAIYPPSCPDADSQLRKEIGSAKPVGNNQDIYQFTYKNVLWKLRGLKDKFKIIQTKIKNKKLKFSFVKNEEINYKKEKQKGNKNYKKLGQEKYRCFYSVDGLGFNITNLKADAIAATGQKGHETAAHGNQIH